MTLDLSIVIVSWNVSALLHACLHALLTAPGVCCDGEGLRLHGRTFEILVVDNASSDGSADMVTREYPQVGLIRSDANLGFTAGNNLALRQRRGRHALLLNPDTRVEGDALGCMLAYLEAHPEVAVVGPQLRYGDGRVQSSRRRFPTLMTALMESTLLEQWFPRNRWAARYRLDDTPADHSQQVDWVVGACMLVRGEALEQAGLLDEGYFMYSEELDWCRRMADAGWRVAHLPEAVVTHYEGRSSDQVAAVRQIHFHSSKVRYFHKHHGRLQGEALRLFLLGTYLWQWLEEGAKYLLGHKRGLRRQRLRAYGQVLRSGLRVSVGRLGGR